jgi:hypothetical protein
MRCFRDLAAEAPHLQETGIVEHFCWVNEMLSGGLRVGGQGS